MTMPYGLMPQDPNYGLLPTEQFGAQQLAANPVANPGPNTVAGQPPRLIDRLRGGTHDMLTNLRKRLAPTPQGFEGLLSPEQIEAARPTILQSLIGAPDSGSSRDIYRSNMAQMVEGQQAASALQRQQAMLAAREEIGRRFPPPPPGTPHAEQMSYLKALYSAYAAIGDMESMKQVGEVIKSIGGEGTRPTLREIETLDANGNPIIALTDPYDGTTRRELPRDPEQSGMTPSQAASDSRGRRRDLIAGEDRLRGDWNMATKQHATVAGQLRVLQSITPQALQNGKTRAAAQMAIIYAYMKTLDPASAVRETEYANAQNAAGVPERIRNIWNRMRDGSFLDDNQIMGFMEAARNQGLAWQDGMETLRDQYTAIARSRGYTPENVIIDHFAEPKKGAQRPNNWETIFKPVSPTPAAPGATVRATPAPTGRNPLLP